MEFRELTRDEFSRIPADATAGYGPFNPDIHRVVGAINPAGEIIAVWTLVMVPHAEPIWIRKDYRKHPTIIRRLWDGVKSILKSAGLTGVVAVIPDSVPADKRIAEWLGASPLPGAIYIWSAAEAGKEKH